MILLVNKEKKQRASYRPISFTSCSQKLLEKIVKNTLLRKLEKEKSSQLNAS